MKNDKSKNIIIIVLIIIILCLLGFIIINKALEKELSKNNINNEVDNSTNNDVSDSNLEEENNQNVYEINYKEEEYVTKSKAGYIISTSKRNLPEITNKNNQEVANKIVSSLTDISNKNWNENIKETADQVSEMDSDKNLDLGVTYLYKTGIVNNNRLTFRLNMDGSFGGVSWPADEGYNYDAKTGDLLTLESIATDYNNLQNIIVEEIEKYIKDYPYDINLNDYTGIEEAKKDPKWRELLVKLINQNGNWYFTETGIEICLPKYSIAVGATGIIKVDIEKTTINQYIKAEYQIA